MKIDKINARVLVVIWELNLVLPVCKLNLYITLPGPWLWYFQTLSVSDFNFLSGDTFLTLFCRTLC